MKQKLISTAIIIVLIIAGASLLPSTTIAQDNGPVGDIGDTNSKDGNLTNSNCRCKSGGCFRSSDISFREICLDEPGENGNCSDYKARCHNH
ncbi:hypothetical protein E0494_00405 [Marinilabiliaceae bacterium JC040]|nr:hypothetical protein [Marinilabiliaceae bacterium JC040]